MMREEPDGPCASRRRSRASIVSLRRVAELAAGDGGEQRPGAVDGGDRPARCQDRRQAFEERFDAIVRRPRQTSRAASATAPASSERLARSAHRRIKSAAERRKGSGAGRLAQEGQAERDIDRIAKLSPSGLTEAAASGPTRRRYVRRSLPCASGQARASTVR